MPSFPPRLAAPAAALFQAMKQANVTGVVIGGAAVKYHGGPSARETKDVDVNVSSFKFLVKLSDIFTWDKDETKGKKIKTLTKIKITYGIHNPEIEEPVACDVHIYDPELPESLLLKYSSVGQDGSRIADRSVLLAMKIRSYGERSRNNDGKRVTDLEDIIQLFDWMEEAKESIPEDIVNRVLTPNCLRKFKEVAFPDDTATVFTYLADVGVNVETIFSKADSA